eukprot:13546008-Alexandrium_andersonii.AAC.1
MSASLVGSEMCIRDRWCRLARALVPARHARFSARAITLARLPRVHAGPSIRVPHMCNVRPGCPRAR